MRNYNTHKHTHVDTHIYTLSTDLHRKHTFLCFLCLLYILLISFTSESFFFQNLSLLITHNHIVELPVLTPVYSSHPKPFPWW